jgi:hypothetical protein
LTCATRPAAHRCACSTWSAPCVPSIDCLRAAAHLCFTRGAHIACCRYDKNQSGINEKSLTGWTAEEIREERNTFCFELAYIKSIPYREEPTLVLVSCAGDAQATSKLDKVAKRLAIKREGEQKLRLSGAMLTATIRCCCHMPSQLSAQLSCVLLHQGHCSVCIMLAMNWFSKCPSCRRIVREMPQQHAGVCYTIVRPGQMVEEPGGYKALVFDQGNRIKRVRICFTSTCVLWGLPPAICSAKLRGACACASGLGEVAEWRSLLAHAYVAARCTRECSVCSLSAQLLLPSCVTPHTNAHAPGAKCRV